MIKTFEHVHNGKKVNVNISGYHKSPKGNITSFTDTDGRHYHLHAHGSFTNHFPTAKDVLEQAKKHPGRAGSGAVLGAGVGMVGAGIGMLVGAPTGSLIATVGPMVVESLKNHSGDMSYIDEAGNEIFWGPVVG